MNMYAALRSRRTRNARNTSRMACSLFDAPASESATLGARSALKARRVKGMPALRVLYRFRDPGDEERHRDNHD